MIYHIWKDLEIIKLNDVRQRQIAYCLHVESFKNDTGLPWWSIDAEPNGFDGHGFDPQSRKISHATKPSRHELLSLCSRARKQE